MAKNQTLSLRSQWLGERLRAARVRANYNQQQASEHLGLEFSAISRFERGTQPIRPSYVRDLITFYGIDSSRERDALLRLSEDAWRKDWWDGDTDGLETGFIDYTWLESRATRVCDFSPLLIPGFLQTEAYATAVMAYSSADPDEIERMVELRMIRQRNLSKPSPTAISVVMTDVALRRSIGNHAVQREQLRHLATQPDHIEIRILPDDADWNPDQSGPFTYFEMPDPYPEVAYVASLVDHTFFEEPTKVSTFRTAYSEVSRIAHPVERSRKYIKSLVKDPA